MAVHQIPDPRSVVYVLNAAGRVKIGFTTNLDRRLREIQSTSPWQVVCVGQAPGGRELEASLHRQFAHGRKHGEWFELSYEDRAALVARLGGAPYFVQLGRSAEPTSRARKRQKGYWAAKRRNR